MASDKPNQRGGGDGGIFPGMATHFKDGVRQITQGEAEVMTQVRDKGTGQNREEKEERTHCASEKNLLRLNYLSSIFIQPTHDNTGGKGACCGG